MCECGKPDCIGHPNGDTTLPGRTSGDKHSPASLTCCSNPVNCVATCCVVKRQVYIEKRNRAMNGDISAMFEK